MRKANGDMVEVLDLSPPHGGTFVESLLALTELDEVLKQPPYPRSTARKCAESRESLGNPFT
jgi:hypothetical protein